MKIKPFLSPLVSKLFIGTIILAQPYWVVEIYANFTYFHDINDVFLRTRPWEALCRYVWTNSLCKDTFIDKCNSDPWWIAAAILLVYNIKTKYDLSVVQIVKISPRFAVMLGAMFISIAFIILDVLSVTHALGNALPVGINPFWKLSFVFKCLTDSVVLDDFKTALDRLRAFKISRLGSFAGDLMDMRSKEHRDDVTNANSWTEPSPRGSEPLPVGNIPAMPSPDGDYIQPSWTADDDLKLREKSGPNGNVNSSGHRRPSQLNRMPSRDRDHDEDMIDVIDHAVSRDERNRSRPRTERPSNDLDSGGAAHSDPATENSAVYMLRHQENWPPASSYGHGRGPRGRSGSESDTDLDLEYAAAVRQVTQESNVDYRRKMGSAGGSTERSVRGKKSR